MNSCHPGGDKIPKFASPNPQSAGFVTLIPSGWISTTPPHFFHFPPARGVISSPNLWKRPGEFRLPGAPAAGMAEFPLNFAVDTFRKNMPIFL